MNIASFRNVVLSGFLLCTIAGLSSAETKSLLPQETKELLESGTILSSSTISGTNIEIGGSGSSIRAAPTDTRVHEAFIYYAGEVYLCHFVGAKGSSTPPYASCYGYWK